MIKHKVMINKDNLFKVYQRFLIDPLRLFLAKDLFVGNTNIKRNQYLKTLVRLRLIEEVDVYYPSNKHSIRKANGITGYKLRRKNDTNKEMF